MRPLSPFQAMELAIIEGRKGFGFVAPNPAVGCIILNKDGFLIGQGYHKKWGSLHAEIEALNSVKRESELKDAVVYITLEPCAHFGKTPPCANRLAQLPLKKVVFGKKDPNPLVSGKGISLIRSAGIEVEEWSGSLETELENLIEIFLVNLQQKRAFISLKIAMTLDGLIADHSGQQRWITDQESREEAHYLRGCHDAILVGNKTIFCDDPQLNVRSHQFPNKTNKVIVLDRLDKLGSDFSNWKFSKSHKTEDIIQVLSAGVQIIDNFKRGHSLIRVETIDSVFDLHALSRHLYSLGIYSVLVEGGGVTISHFLQQEIGDKIYLFIGNKILGNGAGLSWTSHFAGKNLLNCPRLSLTQIKTFSKDILISGRIDYSPA